MLLLLISATEQLIPIIKSVYDLPLWQQVSVVIAIVISVIAKKSWKSTKSKK